MTTSKIDFSCSANLGALEALGDRLPADILALLEKIWYRDRSHNSDALIEVCEELVAFSNASMPESGKAEIHFYLAGETYNHWIVPHRRNLIDYRLEGPDGETIATLESHPLAVGCFSESVDTELDREALLEHVISNPKLPDCYAFHFRRMYRHWENGWELSLPHRVVESLKPGTYRVQIESKRVDAPMPVFEYMLPGSSDETVFLSGHIDHPGMINDSVSGCLASMQAVRALSERMGTPRFTYRVLLVPEIIGSAIYLKDNESLVDSAYFGLCPNMTSHDAPIAVCRSKSGRSLLDIAMQQAVAEARLEHVVGDFHKYPDCGDEISFDTVGYEIPTSTISRIGEMFAQYHSSDDDLDAFLKPEAQKRHQEVVSVMTEALSIVERNRALSPTFRGNPCLSNPDIDLYLNSSNVNNILRTENLGHDLDGNPYDPRNLMEFFLDALNADGVTVLEIANHANLPFDFVAGYAEKMAEKGLVDLGDCDRRYRIDGFATTSLQLAGLV